MNKNYKRLKLACYTVSISMSVVGNLPPLLFLTFRSLYGLSYTFLGSLIVLNFFTQLIVDLIFSLFSHKFNIPRVVKFTPVLTFIGLFIYALWPLLSPSSAYFGLIIGTVIFSAASGLAEVLISPVIAAIPSDDPEHEMSKLHSIYAWGVVPVIIISTLYLLILGSKNWQWLVFVFMLIPLLSVYLYSGATIPEMKTPEKVTGALNFLKNKGVWLCVTAIFLGGAAECNMAQWASGYLERALNIPKIWGDVFGVTLFSLMLGTGRTLYSKIGKNIEKVLLSGAIGATICYLVAAVTNIPIIGLIACSFTGFCVSMLWPGSLIIASDRFPESGVFIYAMMAAGGDLGASVAPQLVGIITDIAINNSTISKLALRFSMSPDQFGMKLGMLTGMLFPLVAILINLRLMKIKTKKDVKF